jgi:hypothetical protein
MTNDELDSILKRARPPEISEESLEMFPSRVVADLKCDVTPKPGSRSFSPSLAWSFGLVACIVAAIVLCPWHKLTQSEAIQSNDVLASAKLVRDILTMFPNQVRAIVEDARGMHLVLSDAESAPASAPLYVRICDGLNCSSFVTFSGQEVHVAGQVVTALCDARGGIILAGRQFIWSSMDGMEAGHSLKITAINLGPLAM